MAYKMRTGLSWRDLPGPCIASTIVRAHQHATATGRRGGRSGRTNRTMTPSAGSEAD
ncbi:hypothetical protein AB0L67_32655 [Streptomyces flaveolus]|uniref:hypothetical protein n=1 Tax=Streptomyces flaveolus TaxID=67297 RepID=UPI0034271BA6